MEEFAFACFSVVINHHNQQQNPFVKEIPCYKLNGILSAFTSTSNPAAKTIEDAQIQIAFGSGKRAACDVCKKLRSPQPLVTPHGSPSGIATPK